MNYEEALNYIHAVQWAGHKPGLTRTRTLLAALGAISVSRSVSGSRTRTDGCRCDHGGDAVIGE